MAARKSPGARLNASDRELIAAAIAARECAHAPWSRFKVGAAARFGKKIIKGCNIEFDVYGLTNCAERTAVFAAFACNAAREPLRAIAVVADTPEPVSPCGACRQVLFECGGPELRVLLANLRGAARIVRMGDLLPGGFQLDTQPPAAPSAQTTRPRRRRPAGATGRGGRRAP